jgi:uncharacterized membrane protein
MGRTLGIAGALIIVFAAVVGVMLKLMPAPLKDSDYLIVGTVATMVSLLALFILLVVTGQLSNVFFKRRKR